MNPERQVQDGLVDNQTREDSCGAPGLESRDEMHRSETVSGNDRETGQFPGCADQQAWSFFSRLRKAVAQFAAAC